MQWKRRHCCTKIAGFLVILLFAVVLLVLYEHILLPGKKRLQPRRTEQNYSIARQNKPYNYIINEAEKCLKDDPFLVLLIAVKPQYVEARDAIRQTWGNESVAGGLGFVRLFLLGVMEGDQDSYYNLTIKTLMGMHWVATYCSGASYVMKTDCDMFVNTEYLIQKLLNPSVPPRKKYFTGYLMRGYAPNRNKHSKWYMSPKLYASELYPTFCSGTGYVFSGDMAGLIYRDVYVGLCLAKLRIEPIPPPNEFLFNHWRVSYSSCKYSHLITSHQFLPQR
uniref:Hexosyltransferase n=1 Tax=Astyanax mexicanus TaxID=7994 RepID=A0A3B1JN24_ASTMX